MQYGLLGVYLLVSNQKNRKHPRTYGNSGENM